MRRLPLAFTVAGLLACASAPPPPPAPAPPPTTAPSHRVNPEGERRTLSILRRQALPPDGTIGIPECDSYLTNLLRCLQRRIPSSQLIVAQQAVDATREAWRRQHATDRAALVEACRRATATARNTLSSLGCSW